MLSTMTRVGVVGTASHWRQMHRMATMTVGVVLMLVLLVLLPPSSHAAAAPRPAEVSVCVHDFLLLVLSIGGLPASH